MVIWSRQDPKPRLTVLTKASSNLTNKASQSCCEIDASLGGREPRSRVTSTTGKRYQAAQ
jgi:hypothetical protein